MRLIGSGQVVNVWNTRVEGPSRHLRRAVQDLPQRYRQWLWRLGRHGPPGSRLLIWRRGRACPPGRAPAPHRSSTATGPTELRARVWSRPMAGAVESTMRAPAASSSLSTGAAHDLVPSQAMQRCARPRARRTRAASATRHQPTDLCVRCGHSLEPRGSWLHLDHDETDKTRYGRFVHGSRPQPRLRTAVQPRRRRPARTRAAGRRGA